MIPHSSEHANSPGHLTLCGRLSLWTWQSGGGEGMDCVYAELRFLLKNIVIPLVQLIVIDVGITLRDLDILVPGKRLCKL